MPLEPTRNQRPSKLFLIERLARFNGHFINIIPKKALPHFALDARVRVPEYRYQIISRRANSCPLIIDKAWSSTLGNHNVLRLKVAMDNSLLKGIHLDGKPVKIIPQGRGVFESKIFQSLQEPFNKIFGFPSQVFIVKNSLHE